MKLQLFSALLAGSALLAACGQSPASAPRAGASSAASGQVDAQETFIPTHVKGFVDTTIYRYDHNRNGSIDLKRPEGFWRRLLSQDERVRSTSTTIGGGDEPLTTTTIVYTMRDLFFTADVNRDLVATREEITAVVAGFDTNRNGILDARGFWSVVTFKPWNEYEKFMDVYREQQTSYSSIERQDPRPVPSPSASPAPWPMPNPYPSQVPQPPSVPSQST